MVAIFKEGKPVDSSLGIGQLNLWQIYHETYEMF